MTRPQLTRLYERAQEVAALEERQRLARELHDSVSQALYGIALGARTARTLLDREPTQLAEPLDDEAAFQFLPDLVRGRLTAPPIAAAPPPRTAAPATTSACS